MKEVLKQSHYDIVSEQNCETSISQICPKSKSTQWHFDFRALRKLSEFARGKIIVRSTIPAFKSIVESFGIDSLT